LPYRVIRTCFQSNYIEFNIVQTIIIENNLICQEASNFLTQF
jgi:hypothetical protein